MSSDRLSINGVPYDLADQSKIGTRRRTYLETTRPSQPFEAQTVSVPWLTWGPLGNSRGRWSPEFAGATDYCVNLDHRYDWLLTATAQRQTSALTAITSYEYEVPTSTVSTTNWAQGAGDGDASAHDELDDGQLFVTGTLTADFADADLAGTYWTTSTENAELILGFSAPAGTVDTGDGVSLGLAVQWRHASDASLPMTITLYETTTAIYSSVKTVASTNWLSSNYSVPSSVLAGVTLSNLRIGFKRGAGTGALDVSAVALGFTLLAGGGVISIDEQDGQLFMQRGTYSTQINPPDMTEVQNTNHSSKVTDSVPSWNGKGLVALGTAAGVLERTAVTVNGSSYATVTNSIEASRLAVGPDRLWLADPDDNFLYYTLGDISTATMSNAVKIVDPAVGHLTGVYTLGEYMIAATQRGARSFTDDGSPAVLGEALEAFPSVRNGASGTTLWGWHYEVSGLGLYAYRIIPSGGAIENPVGPGEGLRGQAFEGPIDGYPTAVKAFKDSLWVAYLNPDGTTYTFRGTYGPETDATGRPEWYSFRTMASTTCKAIGATTARTVPTVVIAEGDDVAYYDLSTRGREIDDSEYTFDTGGGTWFGTRMMMPVGVIANLRAGRFFTENCDANNTWTLAVDVDDAESYINVGSAVTSDGAQTVRPVSGGVPLTTVSFTSIKPRLTQTADSTTAPPQIRGELTLDIDLRPEYVREIDVLLELKGDGQLADLRALIGDNQKPPVKMRLPSQTGVNTDLYGYVITADWYDRTDSTDTVAMVKLREWALS